MRGQRSRANDPPRVAPTEAEHCAACGSTRGRCRSDTWMVARAPHSATSEPGAPCSAQDSAPGGRARALSGDLASPGGADDLAQAPVRFLTRRSFVQGPREEPGRARRIDSRGRSSGWPGDGSSATVAFVDAALRPGLAERSGLAGGFFEGVGDCGLEGECAAFARGGIPCGWSVACAGGLEERRFEPGPDRILGRCRSGVCRRRRRVSRRAWHRRRLWRWRPGHGGLQTPRDGRPFRGRA